MRIQLILFIAIFITTASVSAAQAYVGPGLIIMGNFLGPFLLLVPFLLLLLILVLRWWYKKVKHQLMNKKSAQNDEKQQDVQNTDK